MVLYHNYAMFCKISPFLIFWAKKRKQIVFILYVHIIDVTSMIVYFLYQNSSFIKAVISFLVFSYINSYNLYWDTMQQACVVGSRKWCDVVAQQGWSFVYISWCLLTFWHSLFRVLFIKYLSKWRQIPMVDHISYIRN